MSNWILYKYFNEGNMAKVRAIINRPAVQKVNLSSLLTAEFVAPDDLRLDCEIVAIKRFRQTRGVKRRGQSQGTIEQPYNRLVLCREVDTGCAFYVKVMTDLEGLRLFAAKNVAFVGEYFTIFEPFNGKGTIHGVPFLKPSNPFVPINPLFPGMKITGLPVTLSASVTMATFFQKSNDLVLCGASIQRACPNVTCNGSHTEMENVLCPGYKSSKKPWSYALSVLVSSAECKMEGVMSSTSLGLLFFEEDSFTDTVDEYEVRRVVAEGLLHYREAGVPFLLAGRYKGHQEEEGGTAEIKTIHFCSVRPLRTLPCIVKYRVGEADAGAGAAAGEVNLGPTRQQVL